MIIPSSELRYAIETRLINLLIHDLAMHGGTERLENTHMCQGKRNAQHVGSSPTYFNAQVLRAAECVVFRVPKHLCVSAGLGVARVVMKYGFTTTPSVDVIYVFLGFATSGFSPIVLNSLCVLHTFKPQHISRLWFEPGGNFILAAPPLKSSVTVTPPECSREVIFFLFSL